MDARLQQRRYDKCVSSYFRAFIAFGIGPHPYQLPDGDASRQAHAAVEAQCEFLKLNDVAIDRPPLRKR